VENVKNNKLKGARVAKGFTQREMAEKIGISAVSYTRKENGDYEFTQNEMKKICKILGKSLDFLFGD
jgi:putative transcriptional regulator